MPRKTPRKVVAEAEEVKGNLEKEKIKATAAKYKRLYGQATKALLAIEERFDSLAGISTDFPVQSFKRSKKSIAGTVAAVAPATDWHVEEQVFEKAVNGKNKFDLAIAEARIKRFYSGIVEEIEHQNHRKKVSELWHPLLGDLISGHIHEELMESNTLSPVEACVFIQEMVCSGIDFLLKETKLPIFIPTCCGNHGRTTKKKRIKTSHKNSFEWLTYMTMAKYYRNKPRVTWIIGEGYHNVCEINGRMVRFHHGDGLRYNGGIGGITIPVNKSIAQWQKVQSVDFDVFAHFHQFLYHYPTWICCPCLIGYSEFAVEIKAEFQHPAQAFFIIDRGLGISSCQPIYLESPKNLENSKKKAKK